MYPQNELIQSLIDEEDQTLLNESWAIQNNVVIAVFVADMSLTYNIIANSNFIDQNDEHFSKFLCYPEEDGHIYGIFDFDFSIMNDLKPGVYFAVDIGDDYFEYEIQFVKSGNEWIRIES